MDQPSNPLATVSLVCGSLSMLGQVFAWCAGMIPFVGMINLLVIPMVWLLAFVGLITGILGYRTAGVLDGATGKGAAIGGMAISAVVLLIQLVIIGLAVLLGGLVAIGSLLQG